MWAPNAMLITDGRHPLSKALMSLVLIKMLYWLQKSDEENSLLENGYDGCDDLMDKNVAIYRHPLHEPITKQTSLPTNFTFNVRPPSPAPSRRGGEGDDYGIGKMHCGYAS